MTSFRTSHQGSARGSGSGVWSGTGEARRDLSQAGGLSLSVGQVLGNPCGLPYPTYLHSSLGLVVKFRWHGYSLVALEMALS